MPIDVMDLPTMLAMWLAAGTVLALAATAVERFRASQRELRQIVIRVPGRSARRPRRP